MSPGSFVKRGLRITIRAATVLLLSLTIGAGAYAGGAGRDTTAAVKHAQVTGVVSPIARAGDYIGRAVRNLRNEKLGEIVDLAIDGPRGRVVYAVMASGGLLGLGQTLHAVPLRELGNPGEDKDLVLDLSLATLERQSGFDADNWPREAGQEAPGRSSDKVSDMPADASRSDAVAAPDETPPK